MAVTHAFVNPKADRPDDTVVRPSDWNADHVGALEQAAATVDFGAEADLATATVAATWVAADSVITLTVTAHPSDHDPEDVLLEQVQATVGVITPGVAFEVIAHAPNGTWGRFIVNCTGL